MRQSTWLILLCMIAGTAVLVMLGTWQVQRLFWKEDLIARVEERMRTPPVNIDDLLENETIDRNLTYRPVTVSGTFDHTQETYYYSTHKKGGAGWNVHTPLVMPDGRAVIVNRGFVPFDRKDPALRTDGQVTGLQTIKGLVIVTEPEKPNSLVPENAPEKREFYWRDLQLMTKLSRTSDEQEFLPFIIDIMDTDVPGGLPDGGTTIVNFPNNHLQYAVTWYGLALTLIGVGGYFLYSRRQPDND